MSSSLQVSSSSPNFQPILDKALEEYKKKTGKELATDPLSEEIKSCDSLEAILAVLQGKANELSQSQSSDERLTKWLNPTVNVLNALSTTLGEGVGTVFPPTKIIFSGISILLVAARDTAASRDALIELFDKIENFFGRLKTYTEVPPTAEMTNVMGKIMAEVLSMLAIATKEMKQGRTKIFLKKLVGRKNIEDALLKLDKLEQGELRTVTAQVFKTTHDLKDDTNETKVMVKQIAGDTNSRDWDRLLRWLTPPDPSMNHNIACDTQHAKTAVWVFDDDIFKEWVSSGSLLWIHGKAGSGKSILCSAIIQHIITLRDAGSASVAYFYFDFRDVDKKHWRNLISSLLIQFSSRSEPCLNILSRLYSTHNHGKELPSERALVRCLKDMLLAPSLSQLPTYIILDAVDECPNTSGIPTPREQVLGLVKDLVDLRLPNLRVCITSRPEIDIRTALKPLTPRHVSLHDQTGQKEDILTYVSYVVQSDTKMKRWREDDRKLVIETLSEKADGMFRWVFCQLEMLRHCLAPSLRRQLNELPESLDETYERVLKEIQSTNQGRHARRLLQCLVVAMRPLRVEELAEVLAFDLDAVEGRIPRSHAEWRWEDQEQAVLSACSSLISIVDDDGFRVVQFSHFSVKEYLTSDRLAAASVDVSRYHIVSEPAHLILAQACLGVLLSSNRVDEEFKPGGDEEVDDLKDTPLLEYAAEHWASHSQVGEVSSRLKDAMEILFDPNMPYFLAWIQICDIDTYALYYPRDMFEPRPKPLYYAALCGFHDLVLRLVVKHPEQVNHRCGYHNSPLVAALSSNHVRVAELLLEHGAHVHVRGDPPLLRAINLSDDARVNAVRFLLRHGADVNAGRHGLCTPLHLAADAGDPEVARILLEHRADVDPRDDRGRVPLHLVSMSTSNFGIRHEDERFILAQLLVEHGADVMVQDEGGATPLHFASYSGRHEIAQLLLDRGASAHIGNVQGRNPLHELSRSVHGTSRSYDQSSGGLSVLSVAQLLLEHGVDVNAPNKDHATPLHLASFYGSLEIAQLLLAHGAKANAENVWGQTPLHLVSQSEKFSCKSPDVTRLLLKLGVDVNARDKAQATPLHFACSHGSFETALMLLDHGAEVDAQNADGQTPLHRVSQDSIVGENDDLRVSRLMLERGADVDARDNDQATPLHLASYMSKLDTVQVLLDHGANVHAENVLGQTPLHMVSQGALSALNRGPDVVHLLLKRGADVNAQDRDQATPLHSASSHLQYSVARALLDNGAKANAVNIHGKNALHLLPQSHFYFGEREFAQLLLERDVDTNARDKEQATPLHLASYYGHVNVAEVLLDNGARADAEDIRGQTPLHQVVLGNHDYQGFGMGSLDRKRHPDRVVGLGRRLLERGADVNAQNSDQETPLHLASRLRLLEMARFLLEHGADVNVKNSEGKSPLQLATGRKRKAMRRLLSE